MSQETIDILRQHRADQIELNPSSELFQIDGGVSFYGVFDNSHIEEGKDAGNITQKKLLARIMVAVVPSGLVERTSKIIREDGTTTFTFKFVGKDEEGIPILWLY